MGGLEILGFFGEWIKSRCKALDLIQDELAQRSGCSVFAYCRASAQVNSWVRVSGR